MIIRKRPPEHICRNCIFYKAFYIKKATCFEKLKDGYCRACDKVKDGSGTCGRWKAQRNRESSKWTCGPVFGELVFHLTAIKQLVRENKDERDKRI